MSTAQQVALEILGDTADADVPLGPMTTYRVGGNALVYARPRDVDDLRLIAEARRATGMPLLVVGRGSNLLVADRGFPGIAVSTADLGTAIETATEACPASGTGRSDADHPAAPNDPPADRIVTADAAVLLPVLARQTARAGLTGLEWAVGVPGTVGGAVHMNAGGHGSDIAASLIDVRLARLGESSGPTGATGASDPIDCTLPAADIGLRFRGSSLDSTDIVISARFRLHPGDRSAAEAEISEIVAWRRKNQPGGQNAGSVFVNPVPGEVSAGALIDSLGLRGLRHGSAEVSPKHANFIQADDDGSADDVRALMEIVRDRVAAETGFELRSEIRLIGFGARPDE